MVRRLMTLAAALGLSFALTGTAQPPKVSPADAAKAKRALQEVQDFMGVWNLGRRGRACFSGAGT